MHHLLCSWCPKWDYLQPSAKLCLKKDWIQRKILWTSRKTSSKRLSKMPMLESQSAVAAIPGVPAVPIPAKCAPCLLIASVAWHYYTVMAKRSPVTTCVSRMY
eukprot:9561440-Ditylum_brightwellii.AAC.1